MAKLSTYALAGALALALAPVAGYAADLPEPPILEPVEFGSSWYLRGDVGYKAYRNPKAEYPNAAYQKAGISNFSHEKMDDAAIFGGGVGYKFNKWFRSDVTLDYETKSKFEGDLPCIAGPGCLKDSDNKAKIDAITLFLNGYVDLGDYNGFMPYVGGGVGVARLDLDKLKYTDYPKFGKPVSGSYDGDSQWNFAWNLQAGVGFKVTDNLIIDANYRYVDLGDVKTKSFTAAKYSAKAKIDDITAHEARIGFRYMFD